MGNEQQNEGKLEQARGTVKEGLGDAIGNDQMKREGSSTRSRATSVRASATSERASTRSPTTGKGH